MPTITGNSTINKTVETDTPQMVNNIFFIFSPKNIIAYFYIVELIFIFLFSTFFDTYILLYVFADSLDRILAMNYIVS